MTEASPPPSPEACVQPWHASPVAETAFSRSTLWTAGGTAGLALALAAAALAFRFSPGATRAVLAVVAIGMACAFLITIRSANRFALTVTARADSLRADAQWGQEQVRTLAQQIIRGDQPSPTPQQGTGDLGNDPFDRIAHDVYGFHAAAEETLIQVATASAMRSRRQREVLGRLASRMQGLLQREIEALEVLYGMIEQPSLLAVIYDIDHLTIRARRLCESLAVLAGAAPRRTSSAPVTLSDVLRSALGEVEDYRRVTLVPPPDAALRGAAATDVIHVLAELIENATGYSPPDTEVTVRAREVPAGIAVEVDDLGLGMTPDELNSVNALLADPAQGNADERLSKGQIGVYVIADLARRRGIRVRLQGNFLGGLTATALLPPNLLAAGAGPALAPDSPGRSPRPGGTLAADVPRPAQVPPVVPTQPLTRRTSTAAPQTPGLASAGSPGFHPHGGERPRLPVRQPQAHMAPQLRGDQRTGGPGAAAASAAGMGAPSHSTLAGFFTGTANATDSGDGNPPPGPDLQEERYGQR